MPEIYNKIYKIWICYLKSFVMKSEYPSLNNTNIAVSHGYINT